MARALLIVCVAVLACAGGAVGARSAPTDTEFTLTMDDGVGLACGYRPPPHPPAPGIVLFHGIGGRHQDLDAIAGAFNAANYATLACDARGQGASGGFFDLDGPRTVADARAELDWLAARPGVDPVHIGAWGISLGGGAVFNSAVAQVPWGAIETVETWSDLYSALAPNNLAKSGAVLSFANDVPDAARSSEFVGVLKSALSGTNRALVVKYAAARSSVPRLRSLSVPTFLFQGRRDFIFDITQATRAYAALRGPKRLDIGDFGHSPSTFPGPDLGYVLAQGTAWFDTYLKHASAAVQPPVALARDPWSGSPATYSGIPPTRRLTLGFRGRTTIGPHGKVVRTVALPRVRFETFGTPILRARLAGSYSHVVAVVQAGATTVTEGGIAIPLSARPRWVRIPLVSDATPLPRGTRVTVTIAATSLAQSPSNALYLLDVGDRQRLQVGAVTLTMPVLAKPISG